MFRCDKPFRCNTFQRSAALLSIFAGSALAGSPPVWIGVIERPPQTIDLAILLDTSGSMNGLIDQARREIWTVVNEFVPPTTLFGSPRPRLHVALYEYGNDKISAAEGHVRMILPLTEDLDAVSGALFSLTTDGGNEFCGRAIQEATNGLAWSSDPDALKLIVIAGNEPFSQGDVEYQSAVAHAVQKGVTVHTIFCGRRAEGEQTGWRDGAVLGEGVFSSIDQNASVIAIETPFDHDLAKLNIDLNATYLAYGAEGDALRERQVAQDANAALAGVAPQRAASKASSAYRNSSWDLIDAIKDKSVDLSKLEPSALPEAMQRMNETQRAEHVKKLGADRELLQKQIGELHTKREAFLREQVAAGGQQQSTLGKALVDAVKAKQK